MPQVDLLSPLIKGLGIERDREQDAFNRKQNFLKLDQQRKGALFQDAQAINTFLKGGDVNSAMDAIVTGKQSTFSLLV